MGKFEKGNSGRPKGAVNKVKKSDLTIEYKTLYEQMLGTFKTGKSYVYYHINKTNNEVVYIGKGTGDRAWKKGIGSRNTKWYNFMQDNELIDVKIIASFLSDKEALAIEKSLIKVLQPSLNKQHIIDNNN